MRKSKINLHIHSNYSLDGREDVNDILNRCAKEEIERVLKPGGRFIFVTPGPRHLYELKEALYETPYLNVHKDLETSLSLVHEETISSSFLCNNQQLSHLFAMTPYAYRTGKRGKEKLSTIETLNLTAEFVIRIYQKS